ncbi:MAG: DUF4145 domain-containing protein [Proteobacteria bacterium]|nr:DUF4145 domain-containing protein [Pseudomonadota bacterium]MDA1056361.1 DUF4145 domain-containing protein [Pseudomonadota bacterium]
MSDIQKKEEWLHCNECGRDTNHIIVHKHRSKEFSEEIKDNHGRVFTSVDGFHDWELFECQGCKTVFLRSKEYFSEWWSGDPDEDPCNYAFFPKRNIGARVKPHWFQLFSGLDSLQGHFILISYKQVYELIEAEHYLAAMLTARALLETIAIDNGAGDKRTFKEKLEGLRDKEFIRSKQIEFLEKSIYDSGSAAMHRSYNPSALAITYVLDAIENLLYTIYIEPIADKKLKEEKPKKERYA